MTYLLDDLDHLETTVPFRFVEAKDVGAVGYEVVGSARSSGFRCAFDSDDGSG